MKICLSASLDISEIFPLRQQKTEIRLKLLTQRYLPFSGNFWKNIGKLLKSKYDCFSKLTYIESAIKPEPHSGTFLSSPRPPWSMNVVEGVEFERERDQTKLMFSVEYFNLNPYIVDEQRENQWRSDEKYSRIFLNDDSKIMKI